MKSAYVSLIGGLLLAAGPLAGQGDLATLNGTVTDPTGAVIAGAKVAAEQEATGLRREVTTSAAGTYVLAQLPIGTYRVSIEAPGFRPVRFDRIVLQVGDSRTLDAQLEVASLRAEVEVRETPVPLERTTAALGTVIASQQVREIPLNGRHWASLMALAPGAVNTGDGSQQTIRFVGRARDDNNWTFDGMDATGVKDPRQEAALRLIISTDSIAEFRVNASLYSAELGGGAGANVSLVSKSGTNDFHGGLFEFVRNDKFDARNFFDAAKPAFRLNQFGGNLGGPIVRNRTFFFANYEGLRQRLGQTLYASVPSAAFRARALAGSPAVKPILDAYPQGFRSLDANIDEMWADRPQAWREDSGTLRIDHRFTDSDLIFGRFNVDDGLIDAPRSVLAADREESAFRPSSFALQYQHIFSPTVINEYRAGYNRSALTRYRYGPLPPSISVPGFMTLNGDSLLIEKPTSYSMIDSVTITKGRHTLKTGFETRRIHVNVADPAVHTTSISFASRDDLIRNRVDSFSINAGSPVLGSRRTWYMAFFQDDFKARRNLTLNLGVRYEYYTVPHEVNHQERVFDMWACQGFCPAGTPWYYPDRNNFDPRVSIAWAPAALGDKTVFRIGAGVFHGPGQNDDVNASLDNMAERYSLTSRDVTGGLSFPIDRFLPLAQSGGVTPRSLQRDRRDIYNLQWGFSVQQQLPAQFIMQVGYLGNEGHKLFARSYINVIDPLIGRRPLPTFGRMDEKRNDGNSNFNALQVSLHRQFSRGILWATEYMWSHAINDGNLGGGEGAQAQNVNCRACDRGNSAQDIRHTITSNWVLELPFGPGKAYATTGAASKLLGGWELSGIWTARTGRAVNISVSRSSSAVPDGNTSNQRPDVVLGVPMYPAHRSKTENWLNIAAFAVPRAGTWGNAGRRIARGPGLVQVDLALHRKFRLTENANLAFRAEAFNLFNRAQLGDPSSNISTPATFGQIRSPLNRTIGTGTSRQIQLALRLNF